MNTTATTEAIANLFATEQEADAEYARNVGIARPDCEWILSDRDCWYRNPAYTGPAGRHPEDDGYYDDEYDADLDESNLTRAPVVGCEPDDAHVEAYRCAIGVYDIPF